MAGTPLLTTIRDRMQTLIKGMRTTGGYNYSWAGVNDPDRVKNEFPYALIYLTEIDSLDDVDQFDAQSYRQRAFFDIVVEGDIGVDTEVPLWEINDVYNKLLDDLLALFGENYHLSDTAGGLIRFQGMVYDDNADGDIFTPKTMRSRWTVDYAQDRLTPTTNADC